MKHKRAFWDKLFHRSYKEETDSFLDWLVEQRLIYLCKNDGITSEDGLFAELTTELAKAGQELTASEKTCLALFLDRVEHEQQAIYQHGLLDGITLMKAISKV